MRLNNEHLAFSDGNVDLEGSCFFFGNGFSSVGIESSVRGLRFDLYYCEGTFGFSCLKKNYKKIHFFSQLIVD